MAAIREQIQRGQQGAQRAIGGGSLLLGGLLLNLAEAPLLPFISNSPLTLGMAGLGLVLLWSALTRR